MNVFSDEANVMDFQGVKDELTRGNRVLLLVRHAERPHIDHEDPTFGGALPITENGKRMCEDFGKALKGAAENVQFRASPLRRTVMSAQYIARGLGLKSADIPADEAIGNGSAFVSDLHAVWELFRDKRFFEHMVEYMAVGSISGFAPIATAAEEFEAYVLSKFIGKLGVFTTHDVYVAAYLFAKGVKTDWNPSNWPRFLDSAVIVVEPSGVRRYALLRAGLSDRATGV